MEQDKRYVRIESVVYIELKDDEGPREVEERFLDALPEGTDCTHMRTEYWYPDE